MTTFGYAYHADSREILEGRRAFAKIKAIMCELDGVAYKTANSLIRDVYAPEAARFGFLQLLQSRSIAQAISRPYNPSAFQAQIEAQRHAMERSSGLLGGAFGSLL